MMQSIKQKLYILWTQLQKGILQVFGANVVNKMVIMLSNMMITRILTKEEYGIWSYVLNVYSYIHLVMGLGLIAGALQFGAENRNKPEENRFYRYCAIAGLLANLPIMIAVIIGTCFRSLPFSEAGQYIRTYVPVILLEYLFDLLMTVLRCRNSFSVYSRLLTLNTVLVAVSTCLGAAWGIGGVIVGKYIAAIMSLCTIICVSHKMIHAVICAQGLAVTQKKELWHYSIFNGISSTLNQLLYLVDVSMIAALIGSATELATYKVATLIPNSLTFIPGSVIICVLPNIVANHNNSSWVKNHVKKIFTCLLTVNGFIGLAACLFAPVIIALISGKQYLPAVAPFRILMAGYCISGTFRALSVNVLAALKKVKFNAVCSVITCMADVGLNELLIAKHGIMGAAYATCTAQFIASLLSFGCLTYVLRKGSVKSNS